MRKLWLALVVALLAVMALQLTREAWDDSLTFDETRYVQTGTCAFLTGTIDLEASNPPAHKLLAGLGVLLSGQAPPSSACADVTTFYPRDPAALRRLILAARLPFVALGLLLALVVLLWSRALYGERASLVALAVVSLEPTLLGQAHLATGDLSVSTGMVGCLAAYWAFIRHRQRRFLVLAGLGLGWALLSKASALVLLPVLGVAALSMVGGGPVARARTAASHLGAMFAVAWATVCATYLPFHESHRDWGAPLSWVAPPSWFQSIIGPLHDAAVGHVGYLNGVIAPSSRPFHLYFLEALALKTTLPLLAMVAIAALLTVIRRDRDLALLVWLPMVAVVALPSLSAVDIGVRYVLPVYPLMAVAVASLVVHAWRWRTMRTAIAAIGVTGIAVAAMVAAPLHLGYFNELAGAHPERYLSDSNIDWGQDAWRLRDWWEAAGRPPISLAYFGTLSLDHYGIIGANVEPATQPVHGLLAASVTRITVIGDTTLPYRGQPYRFLESRTPLLRIGTSIEIFDMDSP